MTRQPKHFVKDMLNQGRTWLQIRTVSLCTHWNSRLAEVEEEYKLQTSAKAEPAKTPSPEPVQKEKSPLSFLKNSIQLANNPQTPNTQTLSLPKISYFRLDKRPLYSIIKM